MQTPIVQIENLRVAKSGKLICAVDSFTLAPGELAVAIGANGSGKSTLLRVLAGLERDFTGKAEVGVSPHDRVFVHQSPYLFRGTVWSNVTYGLRARGAAGAESIARDLLKRLKIDALAGRNIHQLSGGERKRTALARGLAIGAKLVLLDEPFSEMDDDGAGVVADVLMNLPDAAVLFTSPSEHGKNLVTARELRIEPPAAPAAISN